MGSGVSSIGKEASTGGLASVIGLNTIPGSEPVFRGKNPGLFDFLGRRFRTDLWRDQLAARRKNSRNDECRNQLHEDQLFSTW